MNRGAGFTKIVAGVDLSPPSLLAVGQAMSVARHHGAELVLLLVGPIRYPADGIPTSMQVNAARLHQIEVARMNADRAALEAIRERLRGQGVEISHMVAEADRVGGLADASQEIGADLIVVGTHGRTGLRPEPSPQIAPKTWRNTSWRRTSASNAGTSSLSFSSFIMGIAA